ncbi:MAG TPA: YceI family protein [Chloroflexota bacterium]|nr:YceI family protein [Chloroflexota bacterium]
MAVEADRRTVWLIDPKHTLVEFAVTYLTFTTVKGHFDGVSGTIRADSADLAGASIDVEIDAASLNTRESRRDTHLRSTDFLDVERHPTITFVSTGVEPARDGRWLIRGNLTIRGTTRAVELDTVLKGQGRNPEGLEVAGLAARTEINRRDFGLTWNQTLETGDLLVGDTIAIQLEVQVIRQD